VVPSSVPYHPSSLQFFRVDDPLPQSSFWRPKGLRMEQYFVTTLHLIGHMLGVIHPIGRQSAHLKLLMVPCVWEKERQKKQNEKQGCCYGDRPGRLIIASSLVIQTFQAYSSYSKHVKLIQAYSSLFNTIQHYSTLFNTLFNTIQHYSTLYSTLFNTLFKTLFNTLHSTRPFCTTGRKLIMTPNGRKRFSRNFLRLQALRRPANASLTG
jgi:hypothetical protein